MNGVLAHRLCAESNRMIALPPNPRYERKVLPTGMSLAEVLALVRRHPALFRERYASRTVNNVYLDTPSLQHYHAHTSGATERLKVRVRWYGSFSGHIARPQLEIKMKRGLVGGKIAYALPPLSVNGCLPPQKLASGLRHAQLPEATSVELRCLEPSLANRYRRHYFESADGHFRLTVDSDLQFFGLRQVQHAMTPLRHNGPAIVLEIKYATHHADEVAWITNAFPFRVSRCSKYVLGIECQQGM